MSFTQEKETNLHTEPDGKFCDGCDKRCEFGIHYFGDLNLRIFWCPTIDNKPIKLYKDQKGRKLMCILPVCKSARQQAIELAHKIVKYCDHYKTR